MFTSAPSAEFLDLAAVTPFHPATQPRELSLAYPPNPTSRQAWHLNFLPAPLTLKKVVPEILVLHLGIEIKGKTVGSLSIGNFSMLVYFP